MYTVFLKMGLLMYFHFWRIAVPTCVFDHGDTERSAISLHCHDGICDAEKECLARIAPLSIGDTLWFFLQHDLRGTAGAEEDNGDLLQHNTLCTGVQHILQDHRAHPVALRHCAVQQAWRERSPGAAALCLPAGEGEGVRVGLYVFVWGVFRRVYRFFWSCCFMSASRGANRVFQCTLTRFPFTV